MSTGTIAAPAAVKKIKGRIPYGKWSLPLGRRGSEFRERLEAGCFAETLRFGSRVNFYREHGRGGDPEPFGYWPGGGLEFTDTPEALRFELSILPDDRHAMSLYQEARSRKLGGISFAMVVARDVWTDAGSRVITRAALRDVSAVAHPAYDAATYETRARLAEALGLHPVSSLGAFAERTEQDLADAMRLPSHCRAGAMSRISGEFLRYSWGHLRDDQRIEVRALLAEIVTD